MTRPGYRAIAAAVAASLVFSSTAAIASAPAATPAPTYQADPWAVLSVMNGGASAVAVCGAAAAAAATAAQPAAGCVLPQLDVAPPVATNPPPQPIPVPPVEGPAAGLGMEPLLIALGVLAAGVGLYLVLHHHHGNSAA